MLQQPLRSPFQSPLRRPFSVALSLGPELLTNGDFESGNAGWSVGGGDATHIASFSGGTLRYQSDTTSPQLNVFQAGIMTAGKIYQITIVITARASGSIKTDAAALTFPTAPGTYVYRITATNPVFNITRGTVNVDITLDRVSLRQVL